MKYRILLFLFSSLMSASVFSQNTDKDSTYWDISGYGFVDYNMALLTGSNDGISASDMKDINLPRVGYSLGFSVNRPLSKRLSIDFGLAFQSQGYKTGNLMDSVVNYRDSLLFTQEYHSAVRYASINIPVLLKINLFHIKKTTVDLGIGVAPVISLGRRTISYFADHNETVNGKSGPDLDVQALASITVRIPLSEKLSLTLAPTFRYNVMAYKDPNYDGIKRNFLSPGIGIYLTYKLTDNEIYDYYYRHIYKNPKPQPAF